MKSVPVKKKKQLIAQNEATLLQLVRSYQGISRIELAALMGVAPSTIGIFVSRLLKEGFLIEEETVKLERGRPRTVLRLNPEGGCLLGVDFEANRIRAICLNFNEEIEQTISVKVNPAHGVQEVLDKISEAVRSVMPKKPKRILGLGVAVPGPVDQEKGTSVYYKHIKGWENVPLTAYLKAQFKVPVYLENNIRAMASAELWFGQGRTLQQYVCIGVRSGIGAGIVANNQIYTGAHHSAGEIGSWRCPAFVVNNGSVQTDSPYIELEEAASVRAVLENLRTAVKNGKSSSLPKSGLTVNHIIQAYQGGDPLTVAHLNKAADALGWLAGQIAVLLDPEKIIFSGAFMLLGKPFLDRIREAISEHVHLRHVKCPELAASELGEFNGALGAAAQIVHHWTPER
ncbi:MAG: ROK family protein [Kiritimatiellales bacterium]